MKMNLKRILALLLALTLLLSLAACGKDKESAATENGNNDTTLLADELGYGYLSEYQELALPMDYVNSVSSVGGKIYLAGDHYDEETYTNETMMVVLDPATGDFTSHPIAQMEDNQYFQNISIAGDGSGYWMIVVTWNDEGFEEIDPEFGVDMEEPAGDDSVTEDLPADSDDPAAGGAVEMMPALGAREGEAEATLLSAVDAVEEPLPDMDVEGDYAAPTDIYTLVKYDMEGNLVKEMDLNALLAEMEYFYAQNMVELTDGDVVLFCDEKVITFGADGNRKEDLTISGYVESVQPLADGSAILSYYDFENGDQRIARLQNGTLTDMETDFDSTGGCRIFPKDETSVYVTDYTILYTMDLATGKTEKVLSWLDSDIVGSSVTEMAQAGEDIAVVSNRYDEIRGKQIYELITLKKTPVAEIPERTILTLGCLWLDSRTQQQVINFNRTSQTHRITMVDYSQYNTEDDYTLGQKQFEKDLLTGACPDIIDISGITSVKKYANKGVFADLTALIEKDSEYTMDSFMSGPLNAFTVDGKLYAMPLTCSLVTLYGSAKLLGEDTGYLSYEELAQAVAGLGEDQMVMQYMTAQGMLSNLIGWNYDKFVDYTTASCAFDSPEFVSILKMAASLPAEYDWENDSMIYMDEIQMLQEGACLLSNGFLSDSWSVKNFYNIYTPEHGILNLGVPGNEAASGTLSVYYGLGISASSKNQDAAWEFIKTMLTDDAQASYYEIPVTVSAFEKHMAEAMEKPYYMEDGEKVYYDDYTWIGETEYVLEPLTQEQVDDFKNMVNNAVYAGNFDEEIYNIINEESAAFFAGDKSAEEVASLIQNRAKIYLGETS